MALITLNWNGATAAAVGVDDGRAVIVGESNGHGPAFADVGELLRAGEDGLAQARAAAAGTGRQVSYAPADLRRPILSPGAVLCVGLNYRTHVLEIGQQIPDSPTIFTKLARALTDPYAPVQVPSHAAGRLDYEGELAAVIGRPGRDIAEADAWDHVAGLTVINDVSMRDFQMRSMQWFAGKSWQACTPVGPAVVPLEEAGPLEEMELRVTVNGEERQRAMVCDLIFDVPRLVADLSRVIELQPGDVIATGTPGGVGEGMDPKGYLRDGDVVEVSVTGIGALRNTVRVS